MLRGESNWRTLKSREWDEPKSKENGATRKPLKSREENEVCERYEYIRSN